MVPACKYCATTYAYDSKRNNTSNLKRHLDKCKKYTNKSEDYVEGDRDSEGSLMVTSFI